MSHCQHAHFLKIALDHAWLGRGHCAPNPSVGAVLVRGEEVLATGWHDGPGSPHAEQKALEQLPANLSDVTLYVTLEPCNHWGRTPPCVDAIIKYGVKRVVYGFQDPNPVVAQNQTPKLLLEKGIEVIFYPMAEINAFYESYTYWLHTGRPWVTVKMAQSLDGKIADEHQQPAYISNEACSRFTHHHRLLADIVLTTAQTILKDNPLLNARVGEKEVPKTLAILDRELSLPLDKNVFKKMREAYVFCDARGLGLGFAKNAYVESRPSLPSPMQNKTIIPVSAHSSLLNLEEILTFLGKQGAHDVWVEAGSRLCHSLHVLGLVQRTLIYVAPTVLGPQAYSLYVDKTIFQRQHSVSWRVLDDNVVLTLDWEIPSKINESVKKEDKHVS